MVSDRDGMSWKNDMCRVQLQMPKMDKSSAKEQTPKPKTPIENNLPSH